MIANFADERIEHRRCEHSSSATHAATFSDVLVHARDLAPLEAVLYRSRVDFEVNDERRLLWLAESLATHIECSAVYRKLAEQQGFSIQRLLDTRDFSTIPVISSGTFKRRRVESKIVGAMKECTSSGTRGTHSIVVRDTPTLERFVGTVVFGIEEFLGHRDERDAFVLGPRAEEAGDLWFSYVLSLLALIYETDFLVAQDVFLHERLYELLNRPAVEAPLIVGPPSLLHDFLQWLSAKGRRLKLGDRGGQVVTAGGWKRRATEEVNREELTRSCTEWLGIPGRRIRDAFNMVELNTVIQECEHKRKHIPPWLEVIPRRSADLSACVEGEVGILSYLDPTPTSYPGFVLSDDLGTVRREHCECGRSSAVLHLARRLKGIEERGCGLKMDRYRNQGAQT
jgi:long-chain-fatty-acid---luciferin-component ligase